MSTKQNLPPFGALMGMGPLGVPAFSNAGRKDGVEEPSVTPMNKRLATGVKWFSTEFARRYLLAAKGYALPVVPEAGGIWALTHVVHPISKELVPLEAFSDITSTTPPQKGDLLVWKATEKEPDGHVAVVVEVGTDYVRLAEQNHWEEEPQGGAWVNPFYSRQLPMTTEAGSPGKGGEETKCYEIVDKGGHAALLGWMRVNIPDLNPTHTDGMDNYRIPVGKGVLKRHVMDPKVHELGRPLPWVVPAVEGEDLAPHDFYLKRSLTYGPPADGSIEQAPLADVPNGWYSLDYDLWERMKIGATQAHKIAMKAGRYVLNHENSTAILIDQFGIPSELHGLVRASMATSPCMGGRFDFGYDGSDKLKIMEYNCDSSGALQECGDTAGKWCKFHSTLDAVAPEMRTNIAKGQPTGQYLFPRMLKAWYMFKNRPFITPCDHMLDADDTEDNVAPSTVYFMVDDDDEERYSALYMMKAAVAAGFEAKMMTGISDIVFTKDGDIADKATGQVIKCIWKMWSYDTILKDFETHNKTVPTKERAAEAFKTGRSPCLSEILLRDDICVIEPIWKCVVGNKALLTYMYMVDPEHQNLLTTTFNLTPELVGAGYVSKPVSGRAGQNITIHAADPEQAKILAKNLEKEKAATAGAVAMSKRGSFDELMADPANNLSSSVNGHSTPNMKNMSFGEESDGRFFDSVVVYQEKLRIMPHGEYFPILCAWMIGDEFGGVVVREDTSMITKLGSIVAPSKVQRYDGDSEPVQ